uniref:ER membrane protein complex subunit 2 n=1 Tax=Daphnia lumholtzi TaxID=42856 RepID=A0A4Y7M9Q2_9CRUS|nr:EOG090X0CGE [Daphnia lumholtzi]SVE78467.1 EOG090X0CGE [Daphnia lumholtzi]
MENQSKHWEDVRDLFRNWREENCRQSEDVVDLWKEVLVNHFSKLGDEGWLVLEQVFIAALDCHNMEVANFCLSKLNQEFPDSMRVKRLKAMKYEALERYEDALDILELIIKKDETNAAPRKRKVTIYKSRGMIIEAIKELTDYLKIFMADQEAWMELSDLYISQQEWNKAAFCVEELMLHSPFNHLYLQRYAEIKYTQGGYENLEVARSYYAQAAKLNPNNVRALYGLLLTSVHMASNSKCPSQKKKESIKLSEWATNQLSQLQSSNDSKSFSSQILEGMGNLQIGNDAKN